MIIEALRRFGCNGKSFRVGEQYEVSDIRVNRDYYKIISDEPMAVKEVRKLFKRPANKKKTANMTRKQVRKVTME